MDITSYLLWKNAGGGGTTPVYQDKEVSITQNGTSTITKDSGYDALNSVALTVNVPAGATKIYNGTTFYTSTFTTAPTFDTSEMTDMTQLFWSCSNLVTIPVLNTSNVTRLESTFYECTSLKNIPQLDLSKVTYFVNTFSGCGLEEIDFSNTSFASGITTFNSTFFNCTSLEEVNLETLGTCTGANFNTAGMFNYCPSLKKINLSNFNATTWATANNMFRNCTSLEELDISNISTTPNSKQNMFENVPANCLIYVKDQSMKDWFTTNFPSLTNVVIKGA